MRTQYMTRIPTWLGSRTINCYISISEVAGFIVNGQICQDKKVITSTLEFASQIVELIHENGGVATLIDSRTISAHWSVNEDESETYNQTLSVAQQIRKMARERISGHGRRKVSIVISSETENGEHRARANSKFWELSKSGLAQSMDLLVTQNVYDRVQSGVQAKYVGKLGETAIHYLS